MAPFNVLVFSKTSSYRHESIPAGIAAIQALADHTSFFSVDASEDAEAAMTSSSLKPSQVIVLLHCTGDCLNSDQIDALKQFVRSGGGIVGIHGATAALKQNQWYGSLLGAHFDHHPAPQMGRVVVEDTGHWIIGGKGGQEDWMDEWYNFKSHPRENENLNILLKADSTSFSGGTMGDDHPLSWCQEFEGGRVYYTALGHFVAAYQDDWYMSQVLRGILWENQCV